MLTTTEKMATEALAGAFLSLALPFCICLFLFLSFSNLPHVLNFQISLSLLYCRCYRRCRIRHAFIPVGHGENANPSRAKKGRSQTIGRWSLSPLHFRTFTTTPKEAVLVPVLRVGPSRWFTSTLQRRQAKVLPLNDIIVRVFFRL